MAAPAIAHHLLSLLLRLVSRPRPDCRLQHFIHPAIDHGRHRINPWRTMPCRRRCYQLPPSTARICMVILIPSAFLARPGLYRYKLHNSSLHMLLPRPSQGICPSHRPEWACRPDQYLRMAKPQDHHLDWRSKTCPHDPTTRKNTLGKSRVDKVSRRVRPKVCLELARLQASWKHWKDSVCKIYMVACVGD
jgi:hypothetical protein